VEVTDPTEPLYGKRFLVESISRNGKETSQVFLRREDGIVLRVPLKATNLSMFVDLAPRAKLSLTAVVAFLDLVKEYELCHSTKKYSPTKSGRRSEKHRGKKS
jgi:hypothetical protein